MTPIPRWQAEEDKILKLFSTCAVYNSKSNNRGRKMKLHEVKLPEKEEAIIFSLSIFLWLFTLTVIYLFCRHVI